MLEIPPSIWIRTLCRKNGRGLTDDQVLLLEKYVSLLLEWNTKINLISRKDADNVWEGHIAHSIAPLFKIDIPRGTMLLDLGSGGGLPGIPWSIVLPSISVTMVDSTQKKVNAVRSMLKELRLSNTSVAWGRAEEIGRLPQFHGKFDYVVARAVGPLHELARLALPFLRYQPGDVKVGDGKRAPGAPALLAFKGGEIEEEVNRTKRLREVRSVEIISLDFDGSDQAILTDKKLAIVNFEEKETR